jgi:signal transduction histidine kinase
VFGWALAAWLLFGVAFVTVAGWRPRLLTAQRPEHARRIELALVGLQSLAALVLGSLSDGALAGMLLVVVAGELPWLGTRPRYLGAWLGLQSALFFASGWARHGAGGAIMATLGWVGFQLFAAGAAWFAQREAAARTELTRVHAELLAAQALLADSTRTAERLRISRELHDSLGHHLAALSLQLEVARNTAQGNLAVLRAQDIAREMLSSTREVVSTLRERSALDLRRAIELMLAGVPQLNVELAFPEPLASIDPQSAHALLRCVQEALTNAVRHAQAQRVWVELSLTADSLRLVVKDDGRGARGQPAGNGLCGIRERLQDLGGALELRSPAEGGFQLDARLPRSAAP